MNKITPLSYGNQFVLTLFTNNPEVAAQADLAGIDRVGVDLEQIGKHHRQGHLNTWISDHTEEDLQGLRPTLRRASLFARCNPIHPGSHEEIDRLIGHGVSVLMLPYFKTPVEAEKFIRMVDERATPVLLVETREAAAAISDITKIDGVREIHIGLNDMRLSLGWPTHFHVLVSDFLVQLCEPVLTAGLKLGIGGVGRAGDRDLPIPSDLVIGQLPRLGAGASLVSRAFFNGKNPIDLSSEIAALRTLLDIRANMPDDFHQQERARLADMLSPPADS
jgi:hypothetical protein